MLNWRTFISALLLIVILDSCKEKSESPDILKKYIVWITNNSGEDREVSFSSSQPLPNDLEVCNWTESTNYHVLHNGFDKAFSMSLWYYCSDTVKVYIYEEPDTDGNRVLLNTKIIIGTGEDIFITVN